MERMAMKQQRILLDLGPSLTLDSAASVRERCLAAFSEAGEVELDLGEVAEMDAAGLQLLCSAARSARERGVLLTIAALSEVARSAIRRSGLTSEFEALIPVTLGPAWCR
jgi:anti-anti-sigma factor